MEAIEKLLEAPAQQFEVLRDALKAKENIGLGLKSFSLPFTESILENIGIFDSRFQMDILNIRDQVILLNEEIELSMHYFHLTFDTSAMNTNGEIIRKNIKKSYIVIQDRCRIIADRIEKILGCN